MKKYVLYEILNRVRGRPDLLRKLKIFAAFGFVGLLLSSVFAVWLGVTAIGYVSNKATEIVQSPQASEQIEKLKTGVQGLSAVQTVTCWSRAQRLLAFEPWLTQSALGNLIMLKDACLGSSTQEPATGNEALEGNTT
jgi:cell division protein FtsX